MSYKQATKTGKPVSVLVMGYKLKRCDLYTSQISAQLNIYGRLHTVKETASAVLTIRLSKQSQICVGLAAVLCLYCPLLKQKTKHNLHVYYIHLFTVIMHFCWLCECMLFCAVVLVPFFT